MDLPAHQLLVGELVTFLACVNHIGTTSMEIGIQVLAQDIRSQQVRHVNSCFFTMVAVDDQRQTIPVPPLRRFSPDEKRRYDVAKLRKSLRREFCERLEGVRRRGV